MEHIFEYKDSDSQLENSFKSDAVYVQQTNEFTHQKLKNLSGPEYKISKVSCKSEVLPLHQKDLKSLENLNNTISRISDPSYSNSLLFKLPLSLPTSYDCVNPLNPITTIEDRENTAKPGLGLIKIPIRQYTKPSSDISQEIQIKNIQIPKFSTDTKPAIEPTQEILIKNLHFQSQKFKIDTKPDFDPTQETNKKNPQPFNDTKKAEIKAMFDQHRKALSERAEAKIRTILEETKLEISTLNTLETFMYSKLDPHPIPNKKSSPLIFNINKSDGYFSSDLNSTQYISVPNHPGTAFLVHNDSILIACSKTFELYELNTESLKMTKIANLLSTKRYAGFSFIGQNPALIGGIVSGTAASDSVEILKNWKEWESVAKLNRPRSHCQAIKHKDKTYVFSGNSIDIMNTVERFFNGVWENMALRLNENFTCFGLVSYKNEIIYFGGFRKINKQLRNVVGRVDPDRDSEFVESGFDGMFVSNCSGSSTVVDGRIYYVDCIRGKLMSIIIE